MSKYKSLVQHSRSLLSQHHAFARSAASSSSSSAHDASSRGDPGGLDVSRPFVRPEEDILETYFEQENVTDEGDRVFLSEVLNGCVRHRKALEVALNSFYSETGERLLRAEYNLYAVLFYLALFRLTDITFFKLRAILLSFPSSTTAPFARFVFDAPRLTNHLGTAWNALLDAEWVRETIVDPLLACMQQGRGLVIELEDRGNKGMAVKKSGKEPTEAEPFLLTVPRPRKLPAPTEIVANVVKVRRDAPWEKSGNRELEKNDTRADDDFGHGDSQARPVPRSVYQGTGDREALEKIKAENREKLKQTYAKSDLTQFSVLSRKPSTQPRAPSPPSPPRPRLTRPVPTTLRDTVPVKLTTAAILREDALVRRQRKQEEVWLNEVEMGLKDGGEFKEWCDVGKAKEAEEKRIEMERRRLEIQLIHEDAFEAKQELLKENRERAAEILAERESLRTMAEATRKEQDAENRKRWDAIQGMQGEIEKAKKKVMDDNARKAAETTQQTHNLRAEAETLRLADLARKLDLIAQIRLLEQRVPSVGTVVKLVDPTETAHLGLLSEMSVAELQERLLNAKVTLAEEEEKRRVAFGRERRRKGREVEKKMGEIVDQRSERRERRREKVTATARSSPLPAAASDDDAIARLREKLLSKRTARLSHHASAVRKMPVRSGGVEAAVASEWSELEVAERNHEARRRRREAEESVGLDSELEADEDGVDGDGWERMNVPPVPVM
ncbi:hypothetical protein HKX48_002961 [Thoreauomyces humboldtii]|nr:hypothetical protein HKX48_002961 [Thoreauomyces humboldtii]